MNFGWGPEGGGVGLATQLYLKSVALMLNCIQMYFGMCRLHFVFESQVLRYKVIACWVHWL